MPLRPALIIDFCQVLGYIIAKRTLCSQDNVIGDATFPICHNDEESNRIKYYNFAKYLAFLAHLSQRLIGELIV